VKILNDTSSNVKLFANLINYQQFVNLSASSKLNKIFLIWGDISLPILISKNIHKDWVSQLEERYKQQVGTELGDTDQAIITTIILWIPSVSIFYLPFTRQPATGSTVSGDTKKRIWNTIEDDVRENLSALQYNVVPLPDSWLNYNYALNKFVDKSLLLNIDLVVEIQMKTELFHANHPKYHYMAQHLSMIDPKTPLFIWDDKIRAWY